MTLRVLHIVASAQGRGAETFAGELVGELAHKGLAQHVLVLRPEETPRPTFDAETTHVTDGGMSLPLVRIRTEAVRVLRRTIGSWAPNLIQAHGGEPLKYLAACRTDGRVPVVYRRIGAAPRWLHAGSRKRVHAALMRRSASIVAVADFVRDETIDRFGVDASRVVTIPNGVHPGRLQPTRPRREIRASLGIPDPSPCVLSLGALTWEKDPLGHLAIGSAVLQKRGDAHHVFVGDGPLRPDLEVARQALSFGDRVHVLGHRTDIGDLLAAADCVLFASREDGMEGMPASLIEAGFAGLPVVGYSVSGVPEVVADGTTGILARYRDEAALADGLAALLSEPELREGMGRAARETCLRRFDIRVVASLYEALYRSLVRV